MKRNSTHLPRPKTVRFFAGSAAFFCSALLTGMTKTGECDIKPPPGSYSTSWVGNSFGGDGGENGSGYWVQDGADEIKVAPDGTVFAGVLWDEAGRCVGLYKDGKVNHVLLKEHNGQGGETAWGWGTANNALAVRGDTIYVANTGKKLMRFHWTPGDIDSARFTDEVTLPGEAAGMNVRGKSLVVVYKNQIEVRNIEDLSVAGHFDISGARDAVINADGSLWVLAGNAVQHLAADGKDSGETIPGLEKPSALAWDNKGRLIVCENGKRQQVLFFDVSGTPKLVETFGDKGGLSSGVPGIAAPKKLFALRGAGTDVQGNLYVGMSYDPGPNGNFFLRAFKSTGEPRWELMASAFVDTFGFDPQSDGATIYSRTAIFDLDLMQKTPGREAKLRALTLDPAQYPDDSRLHSGSATLVRTLQGRKILYTIGQYAGGYHLFTFDGKGTIAHETDHIGAGEQWAWDVDANGDIWHGDAPNSKILCYRFGGWTADGRPLYDWKNPEVWPRPEGWDTVRRVRYDVKNDTLYLTGYLSGQRIETWGVCGATARRYDGWRKGKQTLRWTSALPRDGNTDPKEGPLTPQAMDIAGDYMFLGMVKPTEGREIVNIVRLSDGATIGAFVPGAAVGTQQGWLDMPYALQAMKRKNGEYLILVEEDARAKNLLYRWRPDVPAQAARTR